MRYSGLLLLISLFFSVQAFSTTLATLEDPKTQQKLVITEILADQITLELKTPDESTVLGHQSFSKDELIRGYESKSPSLKKMFKRSFLLPMAAVIGSGFYVSRHEHRETWGLIPFVIAPVVGTMISTITFTTDLAIQNIRSRYSNVDQNNGVVYDILKGRFQASKIEPANFQDEINLLKKALKVSFPEAAI